MRHTDYRYERVEPSKKQKARREIRPDLIIAVQGATDADIGVDCIDLDISACGESLIPGSTSRWTTLPGRKDQRSREGTKQA